ncbi:MAG: hypothetical protein ACP5OH_04425 [Nitrososphaerota archaeon]
MRLFLTCISLSLLLVLSTIGSVWSSGNNNSTVNGANNTAVNNTAVNADDTSLQKLLAEYYNWNPNLPTEQLPEEGNQCVIKPGPVNFLLDPFSKGTVSQTCDIKSGSPFFFPFYGGWCDNGSEGLYGVQDYKKLADCALDSDRGIVTMQAWLDGKEIVNTQVNNKDVNNLKLVYDKYPGNKYYKLILTPSLFDFTMTSKSRFATEGYEKPEDFQASPYTYKAVAHCFCGLIPGLTPGNHELRYKTIIEGSAGLAGDKGWDQETDVAYKLNVK